MKVSRILALGFIAVYLLAVLVLTGAVHAQELPVVSLTGVAHTQELPDAPSTTRTFDKKLAAATAITLGSAALDAWSTCRNLDHGYTENNPILGSRPAKWNVWALTMGESAAWSTVAYFVKRATKNSPNRYVRNSYLFFHALSAGGHTYGWVHNVSIYDPTKYPRAK